MGEPSNVAVLAMLPDDEDRSSLAAILEQCNWQLESRNSLADARVAVSELDAGVVICACDLPDAHWTDVLRELQRKDVPPGLIVASRLADDRLWAEVLNLGGDDVLATPFVASEVRHSVSLAWRQSRGRSLLASASASRTGAD